MRRRNALLALGSDSDERQGRFQRCGAGQICAEARDPRAGPCVYEYSKLEVVFPSGFSASYGTSIAGKLNKKASNASCASTASANFELALYGEVSPENGTEYELEVLP
jgi:hypothetical protein